MSNNGHARVYADHAATTPVRDEVLAAMLPHFGANGFNPSSVHAEGRRARAALDDARDRVARALGAKPREIVFTGSGSEAINLAILGAARAKKSERRHIVTGATEHRAGLRAVEMLHDEGFDVTVLPVDENGEIDRGTFASALREDTALVSLMLANNELGTLHPIGEFAALAHERGALVATDAVQAAGRVPLDVRELNVDLLSLTAHKMFGPKGVGVLYARTGTAIAPLIGGGGQERGLRSGTESVAAIVGFATAFDLAIAEREAEAARLRALRDRFEAGVLAAVPQSSINARGAARLPHISSVAFQGADAPTLVIRLDLEGIAVSAGSACAGGATEPSHVLRAIERPGSTACGTIRFSFGRLTGEQEVDAILAMLPGIVAAVRDETAVLG
jgi:cysteine desulfurase